MRRALLLGVLCSLGCGGAETTSTAPPDGGTSAAPRPRTEAPAAPARPETPAAEAPSTRATIPAGTVLAGSPPGTAFRRPSREADLVPVELPSFAIDRYPFPNEPFAQPTLVTSRAEAEAACTSRGARLCTELEWERACEGEAHSPFPGGTSWNADRCSRDPSACASEFGVLRLGELAPEWTASDVPEGSVRGGRSAVQRGARADAPVELHRCDARSFEAPVGGTAAAFRCCHGPRPDAAYPEIATARDFRDLTVEGAELRAAMRTIPELAPYADTFEPYGEAEGDRALACGGLDRRGLAGWELATGPFAWSPTAGDEAWVVAGRSAGATVIAVLYPLPDGRFLHGGSLVVEEEVLPVAIARTPPSRGELQWSTCWGRGLEGGVIRLGDDSVIRVIQR